MDKQDPVCWSVCTGVCNGVCAGHKGRPFGRLTLRQLRTRWDLRLSGTAGRVNYSYREALA